MRLFRLPVAQLAALAALALFGSAAQAQQQVLNLYSARHYQTTMRSGHMRSSR